MSHFVTYLYHWTVSRWPGWMPWDHVTDRSGITKYPNKNEHVLLSLNINAYRTDTKLNRIVKKAEFVFYKYIFWKPILIDKGPTVRTTCSTCGRKIEGSNIVNNNKSLRAFCGKTRFGTGKKLPQFNRSRKIFLLVLVDRTYFHYWTRNTSVI